MAAAADMSMHIAGQSMSRDSDWCSHVSSVHLSSKSHSQLAEGPSGVCLQVCARLAAAESQVEELKHQLEDAVRKLKVQSAGGLPHSHNIRVTSGVHRLIPCLCLSVHI